MKFLTISCPLKGERNYLHGSDIAFALTEHAFKNGGDEFELSVNSFTKNELFCFPGSDIPNGSKRIGYGSWKAGASEHKKFTLVEGNRELVTKRSYDEKYIEQVCHMTEEAVVGYRKTLLNYTFFEIIIALKKIYLQSRYPHARVKWIFAKIKLTDLEPSMLAAWEKVEIKYMKALGLKLIVSEIIIDGRSIGHLTFTSI